MVNKMNELLIKKIVKEEIYNILKEDYKSNDVSIKKLKILADKWENVVSELSEIENDIYQTTVEIREYLDSGEHKYKEELINMLNGKVGGIIHSKPEAKYNEQLKNYNWAIWRIINELRKYS